MEQMFYKELLKEIREGNCEYKITKSTSLGCDPIRYFLVIERLGETYEIKLKTKEVEMFKFLLHSQEDCKKIEIR